MKFETILKAYNGASIESYIYYFIDADHEQHRHHSRQRDAFRARLVKMYQLERDNAELYLTLTPDVIDEYWLSEMME